MLGVDGCVLGMQVRKERRRFRSEVALEALPVVETGHFREVKREYFCCQANALKHCREGGRWCVGFWLVASVMPTRCSVIFGRDCANWVGLGPHTVVVIIGDGAE